jgi:hypothetical protein
MPDNVSKVPDDEPITIEGDLEAAPETDGGDAAKFKTTGVRAFGSAQAKPGEKKADLKRPLNVTGQGATRCRVFHSKIAVGSLDFMQNQINEWIDSDRIEVKQVGQVIGVMEGKIAEPNLIVTVWY